MAPNSPREAIYHWVVVNIPATQNHLPEGASSKGFVAGGKKPGQTAYGLMGINIYTKAFSSPYVSRITFKPYTVKEMYGTYGKYDGPCAPWNDELIHHYQFTVYALNIATLNLPSNGYFHWPTGNESDEEPYLGQGAFICQLYHQPEINRQTPTLRGTYATSGFCISRWRRHLYG